MNTISKRLADLERRIKPPDKPTIIIRYEGDDPPDDADLVTLADGSAYTLKTARRHVVGG